MGGIREPPPGGGTKPPNIIENMSSNNFSDQRADATAWADISVTGGNPAGRTFEQIVEDEKRDRNILEIQLQKCNTPDEDLANIKSLTYDDLGELMFDVLEIKPENCIAVNFSTGRYDTREVKFLPDVNPTPYLRVTPIEFKNHLVTVRRQRRNVTKVTFKNVPLNVPNEEVLKGPSY